MNDHIPDVTKMINDTPRMQSALLDAPDAGFANIWKVGCDIERELHAANAEIERLTNKVAQLYEGAEEQKQRIKRLEEDLMEAKNKHAALVADVALYEDRGERIKRLEKAANDTIKLAAKHIKQLVDGGDEAIYKTNLFDREECWNKAKEAKL